MYHYVTIANRLMAVILSYFVFHLIGCFKVWKRIQTRHFLLCGSVKRQNYGGFKWDFTLHSSSNYSLSLIFILFFPQFCMSWYDSVLSKRLMKENRICFFSPLNTAYGGESYKFYDCPPFSVFRERKHTNFTEKDSKERTGFS